MIIYRDKAKYEPVADIVPISISIFMGVLIVLAYPIEPQKWFIFSGIGVAILLPLILHWSRPKEYQIMEDKIRLIFQFGLNNDILFEDIDTIGPVSKFGFNDNWTRPTETIVYPFKNLIAIKKLAGSLVFLSPDNMETFYEQLKNQIEVRSWAINLL